MQAGSPSAFAEARAEIQLWPSAAVAYYFTYNYSRWLLALFIVALFNSAVTYQFHRMIRAQLKHETGIKKVRQNVSRDGANNSIVAGFEHQVNSLNRLWNLLTPKNKLLRKVVFVSLVMNLVVGLKMFRWLANQVAVEPTAVEIGLFASPLLIIASVVAALILSR